MLACFPVCSLRACFIDYFDLSGEFELLGNVIALALLYGCPGPRNLLEVVARSLMNLCSESENVEIKDVPDWETRTRLESIANACDEDSFQLALQGFDERFFLIIFSSHLFSEHL